MKAFFTCLVLLLSVSASSLAQSKRSEVTTFCFLDKGNKIGKVTLTLSKSSGTQIYIQSVENEFGGQSYRKLNKVVRNMNDNKINEFAAEQLTYHGKGDLFDFGVIVTSGNVTLNFLTQDGVVTSSSHFLRQQCWDQTPAGVK